MRGGFFTELLVATGVGSAGVDDEEAADLEAVDVELVDVAAVDVEVVDVEEVDVEEVDLEADEAADGEAMDVEAEPTFFFFPPRCSPAVSLFLFLEASTCPSDTLLFDGFCPGLLLLAGRSSSSSDSECATRCFCGSLVFFFRLLFSCGMSESESESELSDSEPESSSSIASVKGAPLRDMSSAAAAHSSGPIKIQLISHSLSMKTLMSTY